MAFPKNRTGYNYYIYVIKIKILHEKILNNISSISLLLLLLVLILLPAKSFAQDTAMAARFDLSFENLLNGKPLFWDDMGSNTYRLAIDSTETHNGRYSAVIEYEGDALQFRAWSFTLPGNFSGKTISLSGYVKTENVRDGFAGLWIRIDPMIAFDNMQDRGMRFCSRRPKLSRLPEISTCLKVIP